MKGNKILVAFVVFLILINCALLVVFWYNACRQQNEEVVFRGPAFDYLSKELKLTPAQKATYEKMRDAHKRFTDSVNEQIRLIRDSFFAELKDTSVKPETINALGKRLSTNMGMLDTVTYYHFSRFRKILNPDQQHRFDQVIQSVLHSMGGHPQGAPPGDKGDRPMLGSKDGLPPAPQGKRFPGNRPPPGGGLKEQGHHPGNGMPPPGYPPPGYPPPGQRRGGPPPDGPPPGGPPQQGGPPK